MVPPALIAFPLLRTGSSSISDLSSLLVLPIHGHTLAGQDMGEGTLVTEFAGAFDEPGADVLWLGSLGVVWVLVVAGGSRGMGEGAGEASGA
jgi:hypothetical protein